MDMSSQQCAALGLAALILLVLVVVFTLRHNAWMKKHCVCNKLVPLSGKGLRQRMNTPAYFTKSGYEAFSGDTDNWPENGTFGALADTFPYGNYADGQAMFYPTYDEYNPYWTRS